MATATATAPPTSSTTVLPQMKKENEKVDYFNLPCPIPYEEIHREAFSLSLFFFFFSTFTLSNFCSFFHAFDFEWVRFIFVTREFGPN